MKLDPIQLSQKIPNAFFRKRVLDMLLNIGIPFNRWLRMRIDRIDTDCVTIISPNTVLRRNHVGGAHACALALLGEYAAGLLVAQNFSIDQHRMIIGSLSIEYHKQGRGVLKGEALAPDSWPELVDGEAWVEMTTEITNAKAESVATCKTRWQVKEWTQVGKKK
jgi:acyl-coenzyme A thioesterase PaaI-like protein